MKFVYWKDDTLIKEKQNITNSVGVKKLKVDANIILS